MEHLYDFLFRGKKESNNEENEENEESGEDFTYPEDMKNLIIAELLKRQEKFKDGLEEGVEQKEIIKFIENLIDKMGNLVSSISCPKCESDNKKKKFLIWGT